MRKLKATIAAILLIASCVFPAEARRRPIIGVAPGYQGDEYSIVRRTYTDAILRAGGIPVILPQVADEATAAKVLATVDGVLFTGGADVNPSYYGEEVFNETVSIDFHRDTVDLLYAKTALARKLPVLGICRGEQLLNVALGGSLYQDLPSQKPGKTLHRQKEAGSVPTHRVIVSRGSILHKVMGGDTLWVNSFHHQAVKEPAAAVTVTGLSEEGVVEAYESRTKGQWLLAVQFHPEMLLTADDRWLPVFKAFVRASR